MLWNLSSKLLKDKVVDGNNEVLKIAAIVVTLKYLSNFFRLIEISMINCKVELKLKWKMFWVLVMAGANNGNANSNTIFFTIKETKICVPAVTLSGKGNQNY